MEIPLLKDLVIIFALASLVLFISHQLRIPSIAGFLITGVIAGPSSLKIVKNIHDVEMLAKIGIMFLLFTIGLEFSLKRFLYIRRFFFFGGALQVAITVAIGFCVAQFLQRPMGESLFLGFLLSLSSTAIVLKSLEERGDINAEQGKLSIAILIFQDIIAVPMILITPLLSQAKISISMQFIERLLFSALLLFFVFILAYQIIPRVLFHIAKVKSRELFLFSLLTICFAVAYLSSSIGLTLAMGAFLAGLIISETDYRLEALGNIMPLQDVLLGLFFVSIGMLLDLHFLKEHLLLVLSLVVGIMFMKAVVVAFTAFCLGLPLRIMVLAGLGLCQIGEFSFVLAKTGIDHGLGSFFDTQLFLAIALISMAITPALIKNSHHLVYLISSLPLPIRLKSGLSSPPIKKSYIKEHIAIIGFGIAGKTVAMAAKNLKLPYDVVDINADIVKEERKAGEPIHFGDASHEAVLKHLNIAEAKVVVIVINDPLSTERIISLIRKKSPNVFILVRTRFVKDVPHMLELGASQVVSDEALASQEILTKTLLQYQISEQDIRKMKNVIL